jgi:hypothetical protein
MTSLKRAPMTTMHEGCHLKRVCLSLPCCYSHGGGGAAAGEHPRPQGGRPAAHRAPGARSLLQRRQVWHHRPPRPQWRELLTPAACASSSRSAAAPTSNSVMHTACASCH